MIMKTTDYTPTTNEENELNDLLRERYPTLFIEPKLEAERFHPNPTFTMSCGLKKATVTFRQGQRSWVALFEYHKKPHPNLHEYHWYCSKDWND